MPFSPQNLLEYLAERMPAAGPLKIVRWRDITTGWESQIISFDLLYLQDGEPAQRELVLRRYYGQAGRVKAAHEYRALSLLARQAFPVPEVFFLEENPGEMELPFIILERIDGPLLWERMSQGNQASLIEDIRLFTRLFVQCHRLDWRPFVEDPSKLENITAFHFVDQWIKDAHQILNRFSYPGFSAALTWMQENRNQGGIQHPSVVHNDFHPQNIILRGGQSPVVIDWPSQSVSDYRFDLAWTLLLARAYMGDEMRQVILAEYEEQAGKSVPAIEYFEVAACCRRLFDVLTSLNAGAEALGMRPEAVKLMKEQKVPLERVYQTFQAHTGLDIPEIQALLAGL